MLTWILFWNNRDKVLDIYATDYEYLKANLPRTMNEVYAKQYQEARKPNFDAQMSPEVEGWHAKLEAAWCVGVFDASERVAESNPIDLG